MSITMTKRRAAFRTGETVELHPDSNPGVNAWHLQDKATVIGCRPSEDAPHLDIVTVVWRSKLDSIAGPDLNRPVSDFGVNYLSTRLRRPRPASDL
jgi:hypothetical protein